MKALPSLKTESAKHRKIPNQSLINKWAINNTIVAYLEKHADAVLPFTDAEIVSYPYGRCDIHAIETDQSINNPIDLTQHSRYLHHAILDSAPDPDSDPDRASNLTDILKSFDEDEEFESLEEFLWVEWSDIEDDFEFNEDADAEDSLGYLQFLGEPIDPLIYDDEDSIDTWPNA